MLLFIVVFFFTIVGVLAAAMVKGFRKVERFDRNRAIERNLRNEVADLEAQQRAARKILREYGAK
jgi:hypothetical protein